MFIYYFYFFIDVVKNYEKGLTSMATRQEKIEHFQGVDSPTISICFSPSRKLKKLQELNLTPGFFYLQPGSYEHLDNNLVMKDILDQTSFNLGEDFDIEFGEFIPSNMTFTTKPLKLGKHPFSFANNGSFVKLEEYNSINGKCYALTSDAHLSSNVPLVLTVVRINNDTNKDYIDHVQLSFTSNYDHLGRVNGLWKNLNPLEVRIDFGVDTDLLIDLKETKTKLISYCDPELETFHFCTLQKLIEAKNNDTVCEKCIPILLKPYFDQLNETFLPTCKNLKDEKCNLDYLTNVVMNAGTQCNIQCKITEYTAKTSKVQGDPKQYGNRSANAFFGHTSAFRTITEEYLIYDEIGVVGNVGGSLGLFLGFSFFGIFSDCLDFLRNRRFFK